MEQFFFIAITIILMVAGLAGSVLPMLPGTPLIFLGALIYAWYTNFTVVTWGILIVLLTLMLLSQLLENLASMIGAKKFGASRWGITGAFCGGIIGLFLGGIVGIIIGPFLGALLFELFYGKTVKASLQIGFGTVVGFVGGAIGKFIIALTMIGVFLGAIIL
jgi:uncharacterized protein YqgC (DUF456 family)